MLRTRSTIATTVFVSSSNGPTRMTTLASDRIERATMKSS